MGCTGHDHGIGVLVGRVEDYDGYARRDCQPDLNQCSRITARGNSKDQSALLKQIAISFVCLP